MGLKGLEGVQGVGDDGGFGLCVAGFCAAGFRVRSSPSLATPSQACSLTTWSHQPLMQAFASLLYEHAVRGNAPQHGSFRLAQAHPGRTGPVSEILALWFPLDLHLHVPAGPSPPGRRSTPRHHRLRLSLREVDRANGATAFVNGIPAAA